MLRANFVQGMGQKNNQAIKVCLNRLIISRLAGGSTWA